MDDSKRFLDGEMVHTFLRGGIYSMPDDVQCFWDVPRNSTGYPPPGPIIDSLRERLNEHGQNDLHTTKCVPKTQHSF